MNTLNSDNCISQNIYISGASEGIGKSVITLAMMNMLSGYAGNVALFRPIIPNGVEKDALLQLVTVRYPSPLPYESLYGCDTEQARHLLATDRYDELLKIILGKYRQLKDQCDHVLCVGSEYNHEDIRLELSFNAVVANNLDCVLMPVINGGDHDAQALLDIFAGLRHVVHEQGCTVLATVINNVRHDQLAELDAQLQSIKEFPVYVVPTDADVEKPSMDNIAKALQAKILSGTDNTLSRVVYQYKVAAMLVPDFLEHVQTGDLIITPGDRSDIIMACLMSYHSKNYPQISGLLLTGHLQPEQQIQTLINGLGDVPFAVLGVNSDTFTSALQVSQVRARLNPMDESKIAKALRLTESHINLEELKQRLCSQISGKVTPLMFEYDLVQRAKAHKQHIVLPEGEEERILRAAEILLLRNVVNITLLGDEQQIRRKIKGLALKLEGIAIVDPLHSALRAEFAHCYFEARKHKNMTYDTAFDVVADVSYFGTLMVHLGYADGMVSGAIHSTLHTIRPALEIIKTRPGVSIVSSVFFMCLEDRVLVYGDCAVNPEPDAQQLAEIALSAADTATTFNIIPRVAMLSYSTGDSGKGETVDKVREAVKIAHSLRPDLKLEGPIQYDAAVDAEVAKTKLPDSEVAGQATVFIFPDLNTGNNTYKAVQRSSGAVAVGPVLQGLNKPVNDLSRGCTITDIVNTVIITAIQAQEGHNT